jgi:hypothetical protein
MTVSFIGGRNWNPRRKPPNQPQVTAKLDHIMFYRVHLAMIGVRIHKVNVVVQISLIVVSRVRKLIFAKQNVEQINIHYMYMYIDIDMCKPHSLHINRQINIAPQSKLRLPIVFSQILEIYKIQLVTTAVKKITNAILIGYLCHEIAYMYYKHNLF